MKTIILYLVLTICFFNTLFAGTIIGSKHDLSVSNYYGTYSGASLEICVFCHTPHSANQEISQLIWNRRITDMDAFTLYEGVSGVPNSPSLVCLSCHDGVGAEGDMSAVGSSDTHNVINSPGSGHDTDPATPNCNACHTASLYPGREWRVGPFLMDDHPISLLYPTGSIDFLNEPANNLKLFNGMVECSSCHDVHNPDNGAFLRVSNDGTTALCKSCHIK